MARLRPALLAAASLLLALLPLRAGHVRAQAPASEYLALGDSLATGVGSSRCPVGCAGKGGAGYVADFAATLKQRSGGNVTVKDLAVNGETTDSFIGDYFTNPSSKSQLARAVAAIKSDGAAIGTITLDIGGNDALNHRGPNHSVAEKQQTVAHARANLHAIVSALLTTIGSSGSAPRLVLVGYYDPYGPTDPDLWALGALNQAIADTAAEFGLAFAQPYGAFVGDEKSLTWIACNCPLDIHPNDQGYALIGDALAAATGGTAGLTGDVAGTVRDGAGAPLAGATVWYGGADTTTDATGAYRLDGVPAGVTLTLGAYDSDPSTGVSATAQVVAGAQLTQDFVLTGAPGPVAQYQQTSYTRNGYATVVRAMLQATIDETAQDALHAGLHGAGNAKNAALPSIEGVLGRIGDALHWLGDRFGG